jgi:hypothetical protein
MGLAAGTCGEGAERFAREEALGVDEPVRSVLWPKKWGQDSIFAKSRATRDRSALLAAERACCSSKVDPAASLHRVIALRRDLTIALQAVDQHRAIRRRERAERGKLASQCA